MPQKKGVFFKKVEQRVRGTMEGVTRSVYRQENGTVVLADLCTCHVDYSRPDKQTGVSFHVKRNPNCPIDEHRRLE
ncbi:MAG TPA: hypothetical protein VMG82_32165 [Candidatus Sulfotelmatobacter sp.]|nr:hypothetical protein [Candidatus Sulfotelmatobacter sp.]